MLGLIEENLPYHGQDVGALEEALLIGSINLIEQRVLHSVPRVVLILLFEMEMSKHRALMKAMGGIDKCNHQN